MAKRFIKITSLVISIGFILVLLIQFVPYGRDHNNPPVINEPNWNSLQTQTLAKRVCYDCHSNETIWPWYSNIAPASWLVFSDVAEGRQRMNFSDWKNLRLEERGELSSVIREGEMPPLQYTLIHPSARLSSAEKEQLISGLNSTLSQ